MRTRNEKILLAIFGAIVFLSGNYYAYLWLSRQQATLDGTRLQLQADQAEAEVDLHDKDLWTQRAAWLKENEPVMGEEGDTRAQILKVVSDGIRQNKLEKLDQNIGSDIEQGPAGKKVSVSIKVQGSMEGICRWLADLQKPANFYAVTIDNLVVTEDMKSMTCSLKIARYFKPREGS
jgi:hypothetical protein